MGIDTIKARAAVYLDRDGVINRPIVRGGKPYPPCNLDELEILPGVGAAIQKLQNAGFAVIVVTNQPDVARGTQTKANVEAINARLMSELKCNEIRVCYHDDGEDCDCRKPKAGLLLDSARAHNIDLAKSYMVGDRWKDIEAGRRAGCRTVFVDWGYSERNPIKPDHRTGSLPGAVDWILGR